MFEKDQKQPPIHNPYYSAFSVLLIIQQLTTHSIQNSLLHTEFYSLIIVQYFIGAYTLLVPN